VNNEQIILDELRALRTTVEQFHSDMRERVATLEAHDRDLYGNGQPGRVAETESRLSNLEKLWARVLGGAAVVSVLVSLLIKFAL